MRTIKFRGKHINDESVFANEWVFGDLLHTIDGLPHIHQIETDSYFEIIPATVGQFTGLLDKNGTEIYEGDILGRHTDSGEIIPLSIVTYVDNGFFAQSLVSGAAFNYGLERILERQGVVGNIHDNPFEDIFQRFNR